jgi:hypothetical protein
VSKKFRVALPAHLVVEITAKDQADATRKAKAYEGLALQVDAVGQKDCILEVGKFVAGCDAMTELK